MHPETECSCFVFSSNGQVILQLDTYGSATRKNTGQISQSLQFDERAAAQLKRLIEDAFPSLRSNDA
ncbi:MAG TPA: hypothetical protein VF041_05380 [Gemmatimonadaceae bacterium]